MNPAVALLLTSVACYLIGSIPFSLLIARFGGGIDLRQHGSGNIGATNVTRSLGAKWGALALLADALKGIAAVGLIPFVIPVNPEMVTHQQVLGAVVAVLGHMFSCWLNFRGGKGVATAMGAVVILSPWSTLIAFVCFMLTISVKRIISLGSMIASITFAVIQFVIHGANLWSSQEWSLGVFSIFVPCLILFRHRSNIARLYRGEEQELALNRSPSPESANSPEPEQPD